MKWNDASYLKAFDHNYRIAYEEGLTHISEGASQKKAFRRLKSLLHKTGFPMKGTKLLDLGCGDGTNALFLAQLGFDYTGLDISEAAIERARQRVIEAGLEARFQVGNAVNLSRLPEKAFSIVLNSYCFHMLVLDVHRAAYFESVKHVLKDKGFLVLLVQRDEAAYEGPITSFEEFCRLTNTDPSGIPFQKCVNGQWVEVKGKRNYLMGRARSLKGYKGEFATAGFRIEYQTSWENRTKVGFILQKSRLSIQSHR